MPSFDAVSEVDLTEVKNAVLQTRKELTTRFDFKGVVWDIEEQKDLLILSAADQHKLVALSETLMAKLGKRAISLKNIEHGKMEISSMGRARQELKIKQGFETPLAKDIIKDLRASGIKVQAQIENGKIRVSGKNRDDLQAAIGFLKAQEIPVGIAFENFRD